MCKHITHTALAMANVSGQCCLLVPYHSLWFLPHSAFELIMLLPTTAKQHRISQHALLP